MLGACLPLQLAPWLALLFAVSDLLFLFCFLPETLPPEKRVRGTQKLPTGPGPGGSVPRACREPVLGARGGRTVLSGCPEALGDTASWGPCASQPLPLRPGRWGGGWDGGQAAGHAPPRPLCLGMPPDRQQPLQFCPLQAPSLTLGFRAAADLLSPVALLRFSAVARGQDPPTGDSKERPPGGGRGLHRLLLAVDPHALARCPQGSATCAAWAWSTSSTSSCSPAWNTR